MKKGRLSRLLLAVATVAFAFALAVPAMAWADDPDESTPYKVDNNEKLGEAIESGQTNLLLSKGEYTMPAAAKGKTLTITGADPDASKTIIEVVPSGGSEAGGQLDYNLDGSTVTFNNLTIKTNSQLYAGYARMSGTYRNCIIQNTYNLGLNTENYFHNCTFNITNEYLRVNGAESALFDSCTFNTDGRAILVFQDGSNHKQTVTVKDCTFHATAAANTWNGIHVAAVSVDGTSGTYVVNLEGTNIVDADFNGLSQIKASKDNVEMKIVRIGGEGFTSLDDAIEEAKDMTGEVVVEIYGKVEYGDTTPNLTGSYDSIKFVGMSTDAEISITRNGSNSYISGDGDDCAVSFENLILSKPGEAGFASDAGFMNQYFTVYRTGEVSYTNCTFPDGACAQGGKTTYNECEFANMTSGEYSLWVYESCNVVVNGGSFTGVRGVKMFSETAAVTKDFKDADNILTLREATFSESVTEKPAIVLTYGESVTLEGNTFNNVFDKTNTATTLELDLDGDPNGPSIVSDSPITCWNDNGPCGVLYDGKIYITVKDAVEAGAEESCSTFVLMYETEEKATLPLGTRLNKNGYIAPNVTVKAPPYIPPAAPSEPACGDDAACNVFGDVDADAWCHEMIDWAYANGVLRGYDDGSGNVGPGDVTMRTHVAVMMWRMAGEPAASSDPGFADVRPGAWYYDAVAWAKEAGLIVGYQDGSGLFGVADPMTREQMATVLYRFAQMLGCDVSVGEDTNILSYLDYAEISEWAIPALQWAVGAGIVSGYTEDGEPTGYLGPKDDAERAHFAAMLMRLDDAYGIL